jgi:hypothetical protein
MNQQFFLACVVLVVASILNTGMCDEPKETFAQSRDSRIPAQVLPGPNEYFRIRDTNLFYFLSDGEITSQTLKRAESRLDLFLSVFTHSRIGEIIRLKPEELELIVKGIEKHRLYCGSVGLGGPNSLSSAAKTDLIKREGELRALIESKLRIEDLELCDAMAAKSLFYDLGPVEWCRYIGGTKEEATTLKLASMQQLDTILLETNNLANEFIEKLFEVVPRKKALFLNETFRLGYFPNPGNITNLYESTSVKSDFGALRRPRAWLDPSFNIGARGCLERYNRGMLATQSDTKIRDLLESLKHGVAPADLKTKPKLMELFEDYMLTRHEPLARFTDAVDRFDALEKKAKTRLDELTTFLGTESLAKFERMQLFAASQRYGLIDVAFNLDVAKLMGEDSLSESDFDSIMKVSETLRVELRERAIIAEQRFLTQLFRDVSPKLRTETSKILRCPENCIPSLEVLAFHCKSYRNEK